MELDELARNGQAGTFDFTVEVTDGDAMKIAKAFTLKITAPLDIATAALPNATENTFYSLVLAPSGGVGPFTWTSSVLPAGLALTPAGLFSGTPAPGTAGNKPIDFTVTLSHERSRRS